MIHLPELTLEQAIFYFVVYAFIGWIIESVFVSIENRRLTNSGFLSGPFIPIYGIASIAVVTADQILQPYIPFPARLLLFSLIVSALEYYSGVVLEELLALKLWDYSDKPFNLNGKICLQFSGYWVVLCFFLVVLIHPAIVGIGKQIPFEWLVILNRVAGIYLFIDLVYSIRSINAFKAALLLLKDRYTPVSAQRFRVMIGALSRLASSFPNLRQYIADKIGTVIVDPVKNSLAEQLTKRGLLPKPKQKRAQPDPTVQRALADPEYCVIVNDIIADADFRKLMEFRHHGGSIWDHAHAVAYATFTFCKKHSLKYREATRGALLHDFFLYDWRNGVRSDGPRVTLHAFEHPKIALVNAQKHFALGDLERDIILKHMWPVTLRPPKYLESLAVSFFDKFVALRELLPKARPKTTAPIH